EVIMRRLRRALAEGSFPELLVIDGGKGQLNAALAAAKDLGIGTSPVNGIPGAPFVEMVGLAKSRLVDAAALGTARVVGRRARRAGGGRAGAIADAAEAREAGFVSELARSPERVFLPGRKDPVVLRQNSAELFLLARLRDEAHRFAIAFHRKLRRERNFQSVLEEIPGIGEGRKKALLRHFGSLRRVKEATAEEIAEVEGFGAKQAAAVHEFFRAAGPAGAPQAAPQATPSGDEAPAAVSEADIDAALADEGEDPSGTPH
ncbi:MAG TPA: helix-hairpin-helix domain-containing protein, partial [Anaeromyxobacteraceae bacterium]|nr:helix-hairpin-helix domain-containing protein [Anaeromyxobacteraceae bacterium]